MKNRREIDGLRALAVIPVIMYHSGLALFSGGFVGVDVFFVISGYLITSIILDERAKGAFSFSNFYMRRARRILPAMIFVLICCVPFSWLWLLPGDMKAFSGSLLTAISFTSNIFFWRSSGYFDPSSELLPLLHTWSLSVEGQFYFIFPVCLVLIARLGIARTVLIFLVLAVASLCLAQWATYTRPTPSFYLFPTRVWELLIGAIAALTTVYINDRPPIHWLNEIMGAMGLLLILCGLLAFDRHTPSPSFYILVPTLGTAFVIIFAHSGTLIGRLLGLQILVSIGLISYSVYLWHQPLLAFMRQRLIGEPPHWLSLLLVCASVCLGYLTWKYVELPFRSVLRFSFKKVYLICLFALLFAIPISIASYSLEGFPNRLRFQNLDSTWASTIKCSFPTQGYLNILCGDSLLRNENSTILFVGDSLLSSSMPGIERAAAQLGIHVNFAPMFACPSLKGITKVSQDSINERCLEFNEKVFRFITEKKVTHVVLFSAFNRYLQYGTVGYAIRPTCEARATCITEFGEALLDTGNFLKGQGIKVFYVQQPPQFVVKGDSNVSKIALFDGVDAISITSQTYAEQSKMFFAILGEQFPILSFSNFFCTDSTCRPSLNGHMLYVNGDHFGNFGSLALTPQWVSHFHSLGSLSTSDRMEGIARGLDER